MGAFLIMMKPSIALSNPQEQCVTFYWNDMPSYYLGYRFWEGAPMRTDGPILSQEAQPHSKLAEPPSLAELLADQSSSPPANDEWRMAYSEKDSDAGNQLSFRLSTEGVAHVELIEQNSQQRWEWWFQPFAHGVRMWIKLTTLTEIQGSFCLQQCLRFTGMYNAKWRQAVAHTPFLSELDMQAMGNANGTLTYARRDQEWVQFPVQHMAFSTHAVGSEEESVDHGLILRESPHRLSAPPGYWEFVAASTSWDQITSGMYWERTAWVSNRHPADCVHASIDFGPLPAGGSRTLQGVVYFLEGSKDDLLALWQEDFKEADD